jgi:hypothetical protein
MDLIERIESIERWGNAITTLPKNELNDLLNKTKNKNNWFTHNNCSVSLNEIAYWLRKDSLNTWAKRYNFSDSQSSKKIGIVMAGNIPLVGFHDLLCVLISGHIAKIKLSSQDDELLPFLVDLLVIVDDRWKKSILFTERLNNVDAVIATGSDNSARYFEQYFKSIPKIIRKNRTSVGVIMGEENQNEYELLAHDIFSYFGKGCRNVSKLYIPDNFDMQNLVEPFNQFQTLIDHNKYANNYIYQKTIRIISSKPFIDLGFVLMEGSEELVSPIGVLYYQYYSNQAQLEQVLNNQADKIQCIVSAHGWLRKSIPFGKAQQPTLNDYADNVDTLKFLLSL